MCSVVSLLDDCWDIRVWHKGFFMCCFCISFQIVLIIVKRQILTRSVLFFEGKGEVKTPICTYLKGKVKTNNFPGSTENLTRMGACWCHDTSFAKDILENVHMKTLMIWLGTRLRIFWWWICCPVQSFKTTAVSEQLSAEDTWSGLLEVMLVGRWNNSGEDANAEIGNSVTAREGETGTKSLSWRLVSSKEWRWSKVGNWDWVSKLKT